MQLTSESVVLSFILQRNEYTIILKVYIQA